jgi:hypothetical protein
MNNIILFCLFCLLLTNKFISSTKPPIVPIASIPQETPPILPTPPLCHQCKFYKPSSYSKLDTSGKCGRYIRVYKNILQYEYAYIARQNKNKCGEAGRDFEDKMT